MRRRRLPDLSPTQKEDAKRLATYSRHLLCNSIGSGKTRTALAAAQFLLDTGRVEQIVVISSKPLKEGVWLDEAQRHFVDLTVDSLRGNLARRAELLVRQKTRGVVLLIHYQQLLMPDVQEFLRRTVKNNRVAFLVDEAHNLKDRKGKQHRALRSLLKWVEYLYLVTGTPLMNNPTDLFNLFHLLDPNILGTWKDYVKRYCISRRIPIFIQGRQVFLEQAIGFKPGAKEALQPIVSEFMIKRPVDESSLPGLVVTNRLVSMTKEQRHLYHLADKQDILEVNGESFPIESALVKCIRLRQITSGTHLDEPGGKERELLEVLNETLGAGRKTIIYTPYRQTILRLAGYLQTQAGVESVLLIGGMSEHDQKEAIEDFTNNTNVLLMNDVGSEGLRLEMASAVVIYDLNWNPARLDQIIGRAHRRGQTRSVYATFLVMADSVDQKLLELIQHKRELMEQVDGMSQEVLKEVLEYALA